MTDRDSGPPATPVLEIFPAPDPEELAAISVAVLAFAAAPETRDDPDPDPAAWRAAALREGVRGLAGGPPSGWGRPRPGWRA